MNQPRTDFQRGKTYERQTPTTALTLNTYKETRLLKLEQAHEIDNFKHF